MKASVKSKLENFKADFSELKGEPFNHFYCPILFKDEDVELCKAHIINGAFPNSSREWTIQRKDVDNFYGAYFEADFISIQYAQEGFSSNVLTDKKLSRQFSPKILANNESVDFFLARGEIPENFTRIIFEDEGEKVHLGLKMPQDEFFEAIKQDWEIEVAKDLRIPAIVSLIKAAHLTLFEMLGYRYVLSAGGMYVGRDILGEFFHQNKNEVKASVHENAIPYFREFANMVRPILSSDHSLKGTISDGLLHVCRGSNNTPWAFIVYISTSTFLHAVLIPIFDQPENVEKYLNFLNNEHESIEVSLCRYNQEQWEMSKNIIKIKWPKKGILYPNTINGE